VGVNGMAHAPVWLQEVMSRNDQVFLLVLEKLHTAGVLAEGLFHYMP
jgi:hypothetical protein